MKRNHKLLASLLVVGGAAAAIGVGTFATFTAQAKNPGNVFAAGTLVLSNTKQGGSTCLSTAGGTTDVNVNNACTQLTNLTIQKPGDSGTANLTIKNEGSLGASALNVFEVACTAANATGETFNGTGNPCSNVQLYIQQYSDAVWTTPSACLYGGFSGLTCDFSDAAKTLATFTAAHSSSGNGLVVGAIAAGASNYFKIGLKLPSAADNTYQGRSATFDLTWFVTQ